MSFGNSQVTISFLCPWTYYQPLHKIQFDQLPMLALQADRREVFIRPLEVDKVPTN